MQRRQPQDAAFLARSLELGGSRGDDDAAPGLQSALDSAAARIGDGVEQAAEQALATFHGSSAGAREDSPGKQRKRRRQPRKVAKARPANGVEQATQDFAKGVQHVSARSQAVVDRLRGGDDSSDEEDAAVPRPGPLFWRRGQEGDSSDEDESAAPSGRFFWRRGNGGGNKATAAAKEGLDEVDDLIARVQQGVHKVNIFAIGLPFCHALVGCNLGMHMWGASVGGAGGHTTGPVFRSCIGQMPMRFQWHQTVPCNDSRTVPKLSKTWPQQTQLSCLQD